MRWGLLYCAALNVFRLTFYGDMSSRVLTEPQLRERLGNDPVLLQWLDFAKANAGKECVHDCLPI